MSSTSCVEQKGIIEEITNGVAKVSITSFSACSSCESKSACQMSESASKYIDVHIGASSFQQGETVVVLMKKSLGFRAILLAYVIPFILILISLITLTSIGMKEGFVGILSLSILVPYYFILFIMKNKLNKTFKIALNKVS